MIFFQFNMMDILKTHGLWFLVTDFVLLAVSLSEIINKELKHGESRGLTAFFNMK